MRRHALWRLCAGALVLAAGGYAAARSNWGATLLYLGALGPLLPIRFGRHRRGPPDNRAVSAERILLFLLCIIVATLILNITQQHAQGAPEKGDERGRQAGKLPGRQAAAPTSKADTSTPQAGENGSVWSTSGAPGPPRYRAALEAARACEAANRAAAGSAAAIASFAGRDAMVLPARAAAATCARSWTVLHDLFLSATPWEDDPARREVLLRCDETYLNRWSANDYLVALAGGDRDSAIAGEIMRLTGLADQNVAACHALLRAKLAG